MAGGPPVRGTAATTKTRTHQVASPAQVTAPGRQVEPVTACGGRAHVNPAWVEQLERERVEDAKIRDAVCRLIARATCAMLPVGSPEWWDAPAAVQLASVAVWGQEYAPESPMKQAARGISGALDWRAEASRPAHAELQRRRSVPVTPVRCQHPGGCSRVHYLEHPLQDVYLCDHHQHTQRAGAVA
jgi:hypothetical protein